MVEVVKSVLLEREAEDRTQVLFVPDNGIVVELDESRRRADLISDSARGGWRGGDEI